MTVSRIRTRTLSAVAALALGLAAVPTASAAPAPAGHCDLAAITSDIGIENLNTVTYCDGAWAGVGVAGSDYLVHATWTGTNWYLPPYDGVTTAGLERGCYTAQSIQDLGAPEGLLTECVPGQSQLH